MEKFESIYRKVTIIFIMKSYLDKNRKQMVDSKKSIEMKGFEDLNRVKEFHIWFNRIKPVK